MKEIWDLYDKNGNKINKTVKRGEKLADDEFHIVVNAWLKNDKGEFLITQRAANKSFPLMWECTGGSALINEKPIDAAIREIKEELGIDAQENEAILIGKTLRYYENCPDILYVYFFENNTSIEKVTIQEEEVNDVMWASKEKIIELYKNNQFGANAFFYDALNR